MEAGGSRYGSRWKSMDVGESRCGSKDGSQWKSMEVDMEVDGSHWKYI